MGTQGGESWRRVYCQKVAWRGTEHPSTLPLLSAAFVRTHSTKQSQSGTSPRTHSIYIASGTPHNPSTQGLDRVTGHDDRGRDGVWMWIWVCVWMGVDVDLGVRVDGSGEEWVWCACGWDWGGEFGFVLPDQNGPYSSRRKVPSSRDPRVRFAVRTFVVPLMVSAGVPQEEEGKGGDSEDEESREEGGQGPL